MKFNKRTSITIFVFIFISLLFFGVFTVVTYFPADKITVVFSGIEGISVKSEINNSSIFNCTIQTTNMIRNGDELELNCRNRHLNFISKSKSIKVAGLLQIGVLNFNKFEIQLMKNNIGSASPDYVYVKENNDINELTNFGTAYYVFYSNGTDSNYYIYSNLLIKDGEYTQVTFNADGSYKLNTKISGDVVSNVNSKDFDELIQIIGNIGFQKVTN